MTTNLGTEMSCTRGIRTGRFVSGARVVAEALFRRVTTPRGMLRGSEEEDNYGIDLADLVGSVESDADVASLPGRIRAECSKEDRAANVVVDVLRTVNGPSVTYRITIAADTADGPFALVVGVDELTVDLLDITEG